MEDMHIARLRGCIVSAAARPEILANTRRAVTILLLSIFNMPSTEGCKAQLRFNVHGSNLLFGGPSVFARPNFVDM